VWYIEDTTPPDRLKQLEQWLYVAPSQEFPTTERINLLEDIAGAALEIRDLRHQVAELEQLLETINGSVRPREMGA
jgi:hypothetical protein